MRGEIHLANYVNGKWQKSAATGYAQVLNPATADVIAEVPLSPPQEVEAAVEAAAAAFQDWRRAPATERVQFLFKLKRLFEANLDELCRICTDECGKTYAESKGEIQRGIERLPDSHRKTELLVWMNNGLLQRFAARMVIIDAPTMFMWGSLTARMEAAGQPMAVMDSLIAASAMQNNLILATRNVADFLLSGVQVINPWE